MSGQILTHLVDVSIEGTPRPAGGLRIGVRKDGGRFLAPNSSANLGKWKRAVTAACKENFGDARPYPDAVHLDVVFYVARPKSHYLKAGLRPEAPAYPTARASTNGGGDFDKLVRAVADAITDAGVYGDDSQVVDAKIRKRYADEREPGVSITVAAMSDETEHMYELTLETP